MYRSLEFNSKKWLFVFFILGFLSCHRDTKKPLYKLGPDKEELLGEKNLAYRWAKVILEATAHDTERFRPRPTITSRYLGLIFTAMYDAWSRYDEKADPVFLQGIERQSKEKHTQENKEAAISYAAYTALREYYYSDSLLFQNFMKQLGYDPFNLSPDATSPEGIGIRAARAVIAARHHDGSNQYGDVPGSNGAPYHDYTNYIPANTADKSADINRWQPKYFSDDKGGKFAPECLTPHWGKVKPLALASADMFRSPPPPLVGSDQLKQEVQEVVDLQANLTDEHRALVEFMRDGPSSVQQAGHWLIFAQDISRNRYSLLNHLEKSKLA